MSERSVEAGLSCHLFSVGDRSRCTLL